ncbi:MAG: hypothetical protein JWO36_2764 [Myxococcales bacterium]|nr:hypothetical protein [Myxococcales bacterium]
MNRTLIACTFVAFVGCNPYAPEQTLALSTGKAMVQQFETCWGFWNDAKWDQLATCYAPDAVSEEFGTGHPPASGPDGIVASAKVLKTAFPDMTGEPLVELVDENHVVVSIVLVHGTQTGPLETPTGVIAPTNRKAGMFVSQVIEFGNDGRAQRVAMYDDMATLMSQLAPSKDREARAPVEALPHSKRVAIATDDERERVNSSVVPQLIYLLNRHDLAGLDTVIAEDVVWSEAAAPMDHDRAGLHTTLAQLWKAIPDLTFRATSMYRAGGYVAVAGTFEGTLQGDVPSLQIHKTGTHVVVPYDAIQQLEGGKITKSWMFFQGTALGMQPAAAARR